MKLRGYWAAESALGAALVSAALALVGLYDWLWAGDSLQTKIDLFFINVVFVVALQTFSGNSGILSFGQMAFVGTGAYVASILTIDPALKPMLLTGLPGFLDSASLSFWPATLAAAGAAGVVALLSGLPILRLDGASAVIAILSLLLIADVVFSAWIGVTRGAGGLYSIPSFATPGRALVCAIAAVFIARWFKDSRTGVLLQGSREDAFSAASVGVPVRASRLRAWVLSGMLSGAGGAVFAFWLGTISPTNFFLAPTFAIVVMLIVGGMGTVSGAVLGAAAVTLVQEVLRPYEANRVDFGFFAISRLTGLTQIALVVMILAVMYFRREGLVGRREVDESVRRLWRAARSAPPTGG